MSTTAPMALPLTLGEQIGTARKRAGLNQSELAARWNESRSTVSRWERNDGEPRFSQIVDLAAISGWPLELFANAETPDNGPETPPEQAERKSGWIPDSEHLASVTALRPTG